MSKILPPSPSSPLHRRALLRGAALLSLAGLLAACGTTPPRWPAAGASRALPAMSACPASPTAPAAKS